MEQEKPTTPVFSIADEIQRRQKEADERRATWEQKRQRATDLSRDGQNPILAFIDTMKPQQDTDRIKRAEKAAKITAWSNFLSALGTGIVGMATEGYIPKTGTDAPMKMLGKIDEWDKLYNSQNREYQQLRLRALMGQQQGEQQAANMDATAAGQDYTLAQKQYDTLIGNLWKAQQEKETQKNDEAQKAQAASGSASVPAEWQTILAQVGISSSGDIDTDYNKALSIVQEKLATAQTEADKEKYRSLKNQLDAFVSQNSAAPAAANTAKVGSSSLAEQNKQLLLG